MGWAIPLENTGVSEYPLVNEVVSVVRYFNNYYYTRRVNIKGMINANADVGLEKFYGPSGPNREEGDGPFKAYVGPQSTLNASGNPASEYIGAIGRYFKFNPKIRSLKRYEGDTIFESRFGSSIRFGSYDGNRSNDSGIGEYSDVGGNPMLLIRNRQGTVSQKKGSGFSNKGYVTESINNDGSSLQFTSGKTITQFIPTINKIMFQSNKTEEQSNFTPPKSTPFSIPELSGDQSILNSDRIIISSKAAETFHYSKKRYSIVTDAEYTVDASKQIVTTTQDNYTVDARGIMVLTTNTHATINAPKIYLGEYQQENEPVLLGRTTALWLFTLCNIMINNIDTQIGLAQVMQSHTHISDSGTTGTTEASAVAQISQYINSLTDIRQNLSDLRDSLPNTMSDRVFTVGGGGAPGHDGK